MPQENVTVRASTDVTTHFLDSLFTAQNVRALSTTVTIRRPVIGGLTDDARALIDVIARDTGTQDRRHAA